MFSFVDDTVLDPFAGSGTTTVAALQAGRNSIANEIDPEYHANGVQRVGEHWKELTNRGAIAPKVWAWPFGWNIGS